MEGMEARGAIYIVKKQRLGHTQETCLQVVNIVALHQTRYMKHDVPRQCFQYESRIE